MSALNSEFVTLNPEWLLYRTHLGSYLDFPCAPPFLWREVHMGTHSVWEGLTTPWRNGGYQLKHRRGITPLRHAKLPFCVISFSSIDCTGTFASLHRLSEFPGEAIWLLETKCVLSLLKISHQLQIFAKSLTWTTSGWPHLFWELWWPELTSVVLSTFWKTRISIMDELFIFHFESMKGRYFKYIGFMIHTKPRPCCSNTSV